MAKKANYNNDGKKKISGYFILNWETEKIRSVKEKYVLERRKPFEVVIQYEFDVKIPHIPDQKISMEVDISDAEYTEAVLEKL